MVQMEHYGIRGVVLKWFKWNIVLGELFSNGSNGTL